MYFKFEIGRQREELHLFVHHPEGKFKPGHGQKEIQEKKGEGEWRGHPRAVSTHLGD